MLERAGLIQDYCTIRSKNSIGSNVAGSVSGVPPSEANGAKGRLMCSKAESSVDAITPLYQTFCFFDSLSMTLIPESLTGRRSGKVATS